MKYAFVFGLFAGYLGVVAVALGGLGLLLLWPSASFALLAAAYAGLGPSVLGKRPSGALSPWALLLLLPYFGLTWILWRVALCRRGEPPCHEVAPGLWLGRRPRGQEIPPGVTLVVDMTAEFARPRAVGAGQEYVCLPTLDALTPEESAFGELVRRAAGHGGGVYVHCAAGRGRSATFTAAVLIVRGLAPDPEAAEVLLCDLRPGVRLGKAQRELVRRVTRGNDHAHDHRP